MSLIIAAAITLYLVIGYLYTELLRTHWVAYYEATKTHPFLMALAALAFWWLILTIFIFWRGYEIIIADREKDWK